VGKEHRLAADNNTSEFDDDTPLENFFSLTEDSEMLKCFTCLPSEECYLNLPDDLVTDNPLDMENIREKQDADNALQQHTESIQTAFCAVESVRLTISYAMLSQEILQTIGK